MTMHAQYGKILGLVAWLGLAGTAAAQMQIVPPRVVEEPVTNYPLMAAHAGVREGEVRVVLSLDDDGKLTDFLVLGSTHPAFGHAIADLLPRYRFAPARWRTDPVAVRMPVTFRFEQQGAVVSMTPIEAVFRNVSGRLVDREIYTSWVCPVDKLDQPVKAVKSVAPVFPEELRARNEPGEVTVDFFIDGEGRVRLPATEAGANPPFARNAVAALLEWRFEPPMSGGEPTIVHASQTFHFTVPPPGRRAGARAQ